MIRSVSACLVLLVSGGLLGCAEDPPERHPERSEPTELPASGPEPVAVKPGGRTEIPTYNTGAGPLFISLPSDFSVRADRGLDYDVIFVYRGDDPIVAGATDRAPTGIARLQISDSAVDMALPGISRQARRMVVGGVPVTAAHTVEQLDDTAAYHSYAVLLRHYFAARDRSLDDLHLHIYVGGSDSTVVEELLESLSTLSFRP